uniref:Uncharacterized protein n=1 Tax=Setaria italica TaxID=4555 RepID=K3ZFZ5_SETIT
MAPVNRAIHPPYPTQTRRSSRWCGVTPATGTRVRAIATALFRRPAALAG